MKKKMALLLTMALFVVGCLVARMGLGTGSYVGASLDAETKLPYRKQPPMRCTFLKTRLV